MSGPRNRYATPQFAPYATAIGELALAWNDVQEALAALFAALMSPPPREGDIILHHPLRVWAAINSDRSQREMLRALASDPPFFWNAKRAVIQRDVKWLLDRVAETENSRNDAIHSPLFELSEWIRDTFPQIKDLIRPNESSGNKRAANLLKKKELLREFSHTRDKSIVLADYAMNIERSLVNIVSAWPERPTLPSRPT